MIVLRLGVVNALFSQRQNLLLVGITAGQEQTLKQRTINLPLHLADRPSGVDCFLFIEAALFLIGDGQQLAVVRSIQFSRHCLENRIAEIELPHLVCKYFNLLTFPRNHDIVIVENDLGGILDAERLPKANKEIFGTADLDELRELAKMLKINHPNPRNAGRKAQLTPDQTVEVLELHRKGIGNTEIAKQFGVSRQTIYKYIYNAEHFSTDPDFTMRMNFMNGQQLCTVIDIDFKHEIVRMKNYTDRIPLRAFGVVENPSWADFEEFLKERCLPASRAGLKDILREMEVPFFDPLLIIEKTNGRMAGDHQWVQIIKAESSCATDR